MSSLAISGAATAGMGGSPRYVIGEGFGGGGAVRRPGSDWARLELVGPAPPTIAPVAGGQRLSRHRHCCRAARLQP